MAPAVTSETSPCASVPHLRAETVPSSPLNADSADHFASGLILDVAAEMSDSVANSNHSGKNEVASLINCVLSTASQTAVTPRDSDLISKLMTDGVDGTNRLSEPVTAKSMEADSAAHIANFKDQQQLALNFVIKNNGKCRSGIIQANSVGIKLEAGKSEQAGCNGGRLCLSVSQAEGFSSSSDASLQPFPEAVSGVPVQHLSNPPDLASTSVVDESKLHDGAIGCINERTCDQLISLVDKSVKMCTGNKIVSVTAKQKELEARTERLLRRLRRLQTREANSFVKQQLSQVITLFHRAKGERIAEESIDSGPGLAAVSNCRSMSTSQLVGLVRRMQSAESLSLSPETVRVDFDSSLELSTTAGQLKGSLRHLESAVDSDATESSSGGESDDEIVADMKIHDGPDQTAANNVVSDRLQARLTWAAERAMIASRWTWLQAQVSDLEYRIRQQSNIYRQLRQLKGPATVDRYQTAESTPSRKPWTDCLTSDVRSDNGSNSEAASSDVERTSTSGTDSSCRSARCSVIRACQQRRIIRSVSTIAKATNRKATSLSTVRCTSCYPPAMPCALCAGRLNHTVAIGSHQSLQDRLALLDPAFHPVLSFPPDVLFSSCTTEAERIRHSSASSSNHFQPRRDCSATRGLTMRINKAHLKLPSGSTTGGGDRLIHCSLNGTDMDSSEKALSISRNTRFGSITRRDVSSNLIPYTSVKILQGQSASKRALDTLRRKKRLSLASRRLSLSSSAATLKSVGRPARLGSSASSASLKDAIRRHSVSGTGRAVYDINNVIIPHCASASAARLEVLKYKEIVTPKWRELPLEQWLDRVSHKRLKWDPSPHLRQSIPLLAATPASEGSSDTTKSSIAAAGTDSETDSEVEDLSDESFAARHLRHEIYEKKQIFPTQGQQRCRSNRSESDHSITMLAEPTPTFDSTLCETLPHSSDSLINVHDSVSPNFMPSHVDVDANRLCSLTSSTVSRTASFSFDAQVLSRFSDPNIGTEVVATTMKSWPPRTFPLDDCDVEQLHHEQNGCGAFRSRRFSTSNAIPVSSAYISTQINCSVESPVVDPGWSATLDADGNSGNLPKESVTNLVLKITKT